MIDQSGSVWLYKATSPSDSEKVGSMEESYFRSLALLRPAAARGEMRSFLGRCKDCSTVVARMYFEVDGAPAEVVLGTSGGMFQRRQSPEAETLLKWLRAVVLQLPDSA